MKTFFRVLTAPIWGPFVVTVFVVFYAWKITGTFLCWVIGDTSWKYEWEHWRDYWHD